MDLAWSWILWYNVPPYEIVRFYGEITMDIRKIKKLIELIKQEGIGEIEIHEDKESVRISQHPTKSIEPNVTITPESREPTSPPQGDTTISEAKHIVKSPMVGTFYAASSPDGPPFVEIGQNVKLGDVLCIVEAMKMFNQIEADHAGKIVARLAENGQPVEYGQPLFIIE
jgi:acetyl-CoA carboxylase biotin carboxyl carrier protein